MSITNIAYIYNVKGKNPYTNEWDYRYLVPAVKDQQAKINYVVVTCEPSKNGVYRWKKDKKYDTWMNGKMKCYYIPIDDCDFCSFEDLPDNEPNKKLLEKVKKMQTKWLNKEVKNHNYDYKRGKPSWML